MDKYDSIDACRISHLVHSLRSPLHYQYEVNNQEDKPAYHFGRFFHTLLLERDQVKKRYAHIDPEVRPNKSINPTTGKPYGMTEKNNKQWKLDIYKSAEKDGKEIITMDAYRLAEAMVQSVRSEPEARAYLDAPGEFEKMKTWTDKETGIKGKARIDKGLTNRVIVEVKTAKDASTDKFIREAYAMEYHTKAAWYVDGFKASRIVYIIVEKTPPHAVNILTASAEFLAAGRVSYRAALKTVALCRKSHGHERNGKRWPGYDFPRSGFEMLELPPWKRSSGI